MSRQKKIKNIHSESKEEVVMPEIETTETQVLESLETEIDQKRIELERLKVELKEKEDELKKVPARVVDEDEMVIVRKQIALTSEKIALKEKIEKQKAYDNQMVTGKFMNLRVPGKMEKIPYLKNLGDVAKWWTFRHGQVYTIPRGFADQLNGEEQNLPSHYTPRFIQRQGPMDLDNPESQVAEVDTSNRKFAFVPVGFN